MINHMCGADYNTNCTQIYRGKYNLYTLFGHCVQTHTEFCPDIAEFCLVKYFSASLIIIITLIMHVH